MVDERNFVVIAHKLWNNFKAEHRNYALSLRHYMLKYSEVIRVCNVLCGAHKNDLACGEMLTAELQHVFDL